VPATSATTGRIDLRSVFISTTLLIRAPPTRLNGHPLAGFACHEPVLQRKCGPVFACPAVAVACRRNGMERTRWEILVLAAAILIGALAIASSMKANRYVFDTEYGLGDTQTGEVYVLATDGEAARNANLPTEDKRTWKKETDSVK